RMPDLHHHDLLAWNGSPAVHRLSWERENRRPGPAACLAGSVKVHLFVSRHSTRALTLEQLAESREKVVGRRAPQERDFVPIVDVRQTAVRPVLRVETEDGPEILCTADHRLAVFDQARHCLAWREAGRLAPADRIVAVSLTR